MKDKIPVPANDAASAADETLKVADEIPKSLQEIIDAFDLGRMPMARSLDGSVKSIGPFPVRYALHDKDKVVSFAGKHVGYVGVYNTSVKSVGSKEIAYLRGEARKRQYGANDLR